MVDGRRAWLGAGGIFVGLGAAVFTGAGVAAADSDVSDRNGSSSSNSRPAESDPSRSSGESRLQRASAAEESDASADTRTVSSFDERSEVKSAAAVVSGARSSHVNSDRSVALRQSAEDDAAAADDVAAEDDVAASAEAMEDSSGQGDNPDVSTVEPVAQPISASNAEVHASTEAVETASTTEKHSVEPAVGDGSVDDGSVVVASVDGPAVSVAAMSSAMVGAEPVVAATNPRSPGPVAAVSPTLNSDIANSDTVTGVKTGHANLVIPVGTHGYKTRADWYLPTQADGTVSATGVIWLQHGFLNKKFFVSALAKTLSQQTNSIVLAPNVASFPLSCAGCWLNGVAMQEAVASMFLGEREALNSSANAAGYQGVLPEEFVLSGQSAGGGFATAAGGFYATDPGNDASLRGVVMFDGFSFGGVLSEAVAKLDDPYIPVYQVAAPPQLWNSFGATTEELVAARPGEFVGATLAGGSHADALLGGNPIVDFFAQLVTKFSPPGNTAATHTLATGWINDLYQGLGPTDGNGIYGAPDQYIVMGDTAAIVLAPPPVVDLNDYLGTWYEVGSVKQFFSIGLVNTKAVYSLNADDSIKVENSGNYFFNNGPESTIIGSALPVDPANNKLNVSFLFPARANPPGNYWIVDLSPDYSELDPEGWAIVSDPTGLTGFLLSRSPVVSDDLYQELLDRASVKGVRGRITPTRQYVSATATVAF